jgi:hypothetical protein
MACPEFDGDAAESAAIGGRPINASFVTCMPFRRNAWNCRVHDGWR